MKKLKLILIIILLMTILTGCKGENFMQLIPDNGFERGFVIKSQKDHDNNNLVTNLAVFLEQEGTEPLWSIAQWDSGPCLWDKRIETGQEGVLKNENKEVKVKGNLISLYLDTEGYYRGKPAIEGDYWPHLLIENGNFLYDEMDNDTKKYFHADADSLTVEFSVRLSEYEENFVEGDWVRACQLLMYFYVRSDHGDFLWFGLQLFDNRFDKTDNYMAYDGGKADASNAMIFSIGSKYVYANSKSTLYEAKGKWVKIKIDIKPFIEEAFRRGSEEGYFKALDIGDLYINGMNYGFETIGIFKHRADLKDLSLKSYIAINP